jgi:hypothetical protein
MKPFFGILVLLSACVVAVTGRSPAGEAQTAPGEQQNASMAGQIPEDAPSLHCIGLRWFVQGDANRNASVEVSYRQAGQEQWRKAMPLFRVESEAIEDRRPPAGVTLFAGSIFNLSPDSEYQVRLSLRDPDGGATDKTLSRRTWREPTAPEPKRTLYVAPGSGEGSGTQAAPFRGIAAAAAQMQAGDLFLLAPGVYQGPLELTSDGTAQAPIVWRGPAEGQAVIEGPADGTAIVAKGRKHVFFERLTIRNARQAMAVDGAEFLVIRRCRMTDVDKGISDDAHAHRLFIADNVIEGRIPYPQKHKTEDRGIELSGTGHVICHNRVRCFRDAVDTRAPWPVRDIDIHNNDISDCEDDGIELDFSEQNVRAYNNRLTNCRLGISFQPSCGGPNYAIRNVLYNITSESFKLHLTPTNRDAPDWKLGPHRTSGGVLIHNTVIKKDVAFRVWSDEGPAQYFYARNNLLVGSPAYWCIEITPPMRYADFDYNAYVAEQLRKFARWNEKTYDTLEAFGQDTGLERHGLVLTSFAGVFAESVCLPKDPDVAEPVERNCPVLHDKSPVLDRGQVLPTINEDFRGEGPDLGAYELGAQGPHYGPRP